MLCVCSLQSPHLIGILLPYIFLCSFKAEIRSSLKGRNSPVLKCCYVLQGGGEREKYVKVAHVGKLSLHSVEEPLGRNSRNSQEEDWITSRCWVPEMRISSTLSPLLQSLCFIYVFKPISQVILIHTYHSMRTKTNTVS